MNKDWGEVAEKFDVIADSIKGKRLSFASEATTRFKIIDRIIKDVLCWDTNNIDVELRTPSCSEEYIDYFLTLGDWKILIEAKKIGKAFPKPSRMKRFKLNSAFLKNPDIKLAIEQAKTYATSINADIAVVTNGRVWIFFDCHNLSDSTYAEVLSPFDTALDAQRLFELFSIFSVQNNSLKSLSQKPAFTANKLIDKSSNINGRINRNTIADHITTALNNAFYNDAILNNQDTLEYCFVKTENRTRYDSLLNIHILDAKPQTKDSFKRQRKAKRNHIFENIIKNGIKDSAPPVTLIVGSVGSGKSTYLAHYRNVSGKEVIEDSGVYWFHVDLEKMGREKPVRKFIYEELLNQLSKDEFFTKIDRRVVAEAYKDEFVFLRDTILGLSEDDGNLQKKQQEQIQKDYDEKEPFVNKILKYISKHHGSVIVLDNIDLYEDAILESKVFAEGISISKEIKANVLVSIRDTTFVKHQSDSTFDAYELRTLWIDPPNFREVLTRRLTYSRKLLEAEKAILKTPDGKKFEIQDLGSFFDIVQRSLLAGSAGIFIESIADKNLRLGLELVINFLTSGHIEADRAIDVYYNQKNDYIFPFHEIFKGTMLSHWKHFREERSKCMNLLDSQLADKKLLLLRLTICKILSERARLEKTVETSVSKLYSILNHRGISKNYLIKCLISLMEKGLIKSIDAKEITDKSIIVITRTGAYYISVLIKKFVYLEEMMYETSIYDDSLFEDLHAKTIDIEYRSDNVCVKMCNRIERINKFISYIKTIEDSFWEGTNNLYNIIAREIEPAICKELASISEKVNRHHRYTSRS